MKLVAALLTLTAFCAAGEDPSLKPYDDATVEAKYAERYRVLTDLDGDGVNDMLLSGSQVEFGTMGGPWAVHLNRKGDYVRVGEIWAHPMAIAFEPDQGKIQRVPKTRRFARIWVYLKSSGSAGKLGYYRVGVNTVDQLSGIEIYPGDGGTNLGRSLYKAIFAKSPIPFILQHSSTTADGKVTWAETER